MLSRDPVRNTTRDYPWAKVFFGFVGGMILCNLAVNLLASIKIIVATVMQVSLADVEMDEPVLSVLLHWWCPKMYAGKRRANKKQRKHDIFELCTLKLPFTVPVAVGRI